MSIIERAMGKQNGVEIADDSADTSPEKNSPSDEVSNNRDDLSALKSSSPNAEHKTINDIPSTATNDVQGETTRAVPTAANSQSASQRDSTPDAVLDFADLAANGFIDPTAGVSRLTEEYQQIKRRIIGNTVDGIFEGPGAPNLVMITSSVPNEGKTFSSINLALSIAMEVDRTVLLVDVDIIKSDLTRFFGLTNRPGLYDLLGHPELDISDVICKTNVPGLSVIPSGTDSRGVTEKLASEAMKKLTIELAHRYADRLVIFDAPPVLATSSARAVAPYIGQTVLVVEACKTPSETVKHALNVMEPLPLAGVILNKARYRAGGHSYYYGYDYGYGYGYSYDPNQNSPQQR